MSRLADQPARDLALDVTQSFIVQAPAGSGKTELLTLRYLRLLAISEQPEEVLAITFTKKAASEMRDRIISTLRMARQATASGENPASEFERLRLNVATQVLQRDQQQCWQLCDNPARLRVQTIDSFCFYLARQLPVLSRIGGNPVIREDVEDCFVEAIASTLARLETESALADAIEILLEELDNDLPRIERMLMRLLHKRDQWMSYVLEVGADRQAAGDYLSASLDELVRERLAEISARLQPLKNEISAILDYSIDNLESAQPELAAVAWQRSELPPADVDSLPLWRHLATLLFTQSMSWRTSLTAKQGFPAPSKASGEEKIRRSDFKERFQALSTALSAPADMGELLGEINLLPAGDVLADRWAFITALLTVLTHLGGELLLAFRKYQCIDYTETSAAALSALGSADAPTDLAMALDHRIQHVLVDEFQDTSEVQRQLLERLTSGWEANDGRSLFLVGDPMQSIYGFRNANVGIFLQVQESGINALALRPLTLSANFRSRRDVVDWVNTYFEGAFPARPDRSRGAVPFSPSEAVHPAAAGAGVSVALICHEADAKEAARSREVSLTIERIQALQEQEAGSDIAILGRSRSHLLPIIHGLREAGIPWQATDVDPLDVLMPVEDLFSLTRALLQPGDQLAWMALLRAPWCGLSSAELLLLREQSQQRSIWGYLQSKALPEGLEAKVRARLENFTRVLEFSMSMRFRCPLRQLVEATWTLLRGADCCRDEVELRSAARYFDLLEEFETAGGIHNLEEFREQLGKTFVPSPPAASSAAGTRVAVRLLTMHKAKGLEFDHVILPALSRQTGQDPRELLLWHERLNADGQSRLFLAARSTSGEVDDRLYEMLRHEQQIKSRLENTRLLYIAVTRARKSALLLATASYGEEELKAPSERSLLASLWPRLGNELGSLRLENVDASVEADTALETGPGLATPILTLADDRGLTTSEQEALDEAMQELQARETEPELETDAAEDPLAACIGELVHRALESLVATGEHSQGPEQRAYWRRELARVCPRDADIDVAIGKIQAALDNCAGDSANAWLFDSRAQASACELAFSSVSDSGLRQSIVDRTLIDEAGVRWIVDYKTGAPQPGQKEAEFIREQTRLYRDQLRRYRALFSTEYKRPIKTALYFTALPKLVEFAD